MTFPSSVSGETLKRGETLRETLPLHLVPTFHFETGLKRSDEASVSSAFQERFTLKRSETLPRAGTCAVSNNSIRVNSGTSTGKRVNQTRGCARKAQP